MSMTKTDYELVARCINASARIVDDTDNPIDKGYGLAVKHITKYLALAFEQANPDFKRDRFLTACGATDNVSYI